MPASLDVLSRFLFPAPPSSYSRESFPEELLWIPKVLELGEACPPDQCIPCLFLKYPSARFLILYLHSNAEDIGKCYSFLNVMREQFQVHVLAVEYPGYGICPGGPATADTVTENAFAAFRFIREVIQWPTDSIKLFGRSIGTGPAVALAVQYKVAGVILITPFLSVRELVKDSIGIFAYMVEERFPSKDRMHLIRSPLLIVHGQKDTLIPCRHGTCLHDMARSRKMLVCPEAMEHNTNLLANVGFLVVPMLQFFALPDYCFEEIAVPSWCFQVNKELSMTGGARAVIQGVVSQPRQTPKGDFPQRLPSNDLDPMRSGVLTPRATDLQSSASRKSRELARITWTHAQEAKSDDTGEVISLGSVTSATKTLSKMEA